MRITSFNVENFFARPKAMNLATWADGAPVLAAHAELNTLLEQPSYTATDKTRIAQLLSTLGLEKSDSAAMAVLRQVRGRLVSRPRTGGLTIVADGRGDWVGWVDLTTEPVTEAAIANTARVIRDLDPQVLGVVEAENRVVLKHFTDAELRTSKRAGERPRRVGRAAVPARHAHRRQRRPRDRRRPARPGRATGSRTSAATSTTATVTGWCSPATVPSTPSAPRVGTSSSSW
jgi:hypothetical protein